MTFTEGAIQYARTREKIMGLLDGDLKRHRTAFALIHLCAHNTVLTKWSTADDVMESVKCGVRKRCQKEWSNNPNYCSEWWRIGRILRDHPTEWKAYCESVVWLNTLPERQREVAKTWHKMERWKSLQEEGAGSVDAACD